jgi:DNA-directed RNA polymerase subunit H (RpoH/RPB5)
MGFHGREDGKALLIALGTGDVLIGMGMTKKRCPFIIISDPINIDQEAKIGDPVESKSKFDVIISIESLESLAVLEEAIEKVRGYLESRNEIAI